MVIIKQFGFIVCLMFGNFASFALENHLYDIPENTRMYDAEYIDSHFVKTQDVDRVVSSLVTNRVDAVLNPMSWEFVYSNKTVVATNEFNVTPYVMNRVQFIKKDDIKIQDYNVVDRNIVSVRDDNHNYSLLIERDVNGVTDENPLKLDFSILIAKGHFLCNFPTNEVGMVEISQSQMPIVMRLEEPQKGYVICTLQSLN